MLSPQGVGLTDSGPLGTLQIIGRAGRCRSGNPFCSLNPPPVYPQPLCPREHSWPDGGVGSCNATEAYLGRFKDPGGRSSSSMYGTQPTPRAYLSHLESSTTSPARGVGDDSLDSSTGWDGAGDGGHGALDSAASGHRAGPAYARRASYGRPAESPDRARRYSSGSALGGARGPLVPPGSLHQAEGSMSMMFGAGDLTGMDDGEWSGGESPHHTSTRYQLPVFQTGYSPGAGM